MYSVGSCIHAIQQVPIGNEAALGRKDGRSRPELADTWRRSCPILRFGLTNSIVYCFSNSLKPIVMAEQRGRSAPKAPLSKYIGTRSTTSAPRQAKANQVVKLVEGGKHAAFAHQLGDR
jgi:hypothetical protein